MPSSHRSTRPRRSLAMLGCALLAAGGFGRACRAPAPSADPPPGFFEKSRALHFPDGPPPGVIYLRIHGGMVPELWSGFALARGAVEVPPGAEARIVVTNDDAFDLRWLGGLRPYDLQSLELTGSSIGHRALLRLRRLSGLHALSIGRTGATDATIEALADIPGLRRLYAPDTRATGRAIRALGGHERLQALDLKGCDIDDASLEALADIPSLELLNLGGTRVTDAGVARLPVVAPRLRSLWLNFTAVGNASMTALARMPRLEYLNLESTFVTDDGVAALAESNSLADPMLNRVEVGDAGIAALGRLETLRWLDFGSTRVTSRGVAALAGRRVRGINLTDTAVDDAVIDVLLGFPLLEGAGLMGTAVTETGFERLLEAMPDLDAKVGEPPRPDPKRGWKNRESDPAREDEADAGRAGASPSAPAIHPLDDPAGGDSTEEGGVRRRGRLAGPSRTPRPRRTRNAGGRCAPSCRCVRRSSRRRVRRAIRRCVV